MISLRNTVFYTLFFAFSAVAIPLFWITFIPVRVLFKKRIWQKVLRYAIWVYGKIIVFVLARVLVKIDCKKALPIDLPVIYVFNHRSASDAFLVAGIGGEVVQVVNVWPLQLPVLGYFAKLAGYLSVKEMSFDEFSAKCCELLKERVSIASFPEGTRAGSKKLGQFHGETFRVAMSAKASVVPVCVMGSEDKPARGSHIINPGKITIRSLKPIIWDEYKHMSVFAFKQHVWRIMDEYMVSYEGALE